MYKRIKSFEVLNSTCLRDVVRALIRGVEEKERWNSCGQVQIRYNKRIETGRTAVA